MAVKSSAPRANAGRSTPTNGIRAASRAPKPNGKKTAASVRVPPTRASKPKAVFGPGTECVHAGQDLPRTGPLVPPLVQSTTYGWSDLDSPPEVTYARAGNATVEALERRLAVLEEGAAAICFSSGLAAIDALVRTVPKDGRIVCGNNVYGGTVRLLREIHTGCTVDWVDSSDTAQLIKALSKPTNLVIVETPSNPTLAITNITVAARAAHAAGALLAVDNTFLTPLSQKPLTLGADVSIHSTTKYLDGHNATLGGAVVVGTGHEGDGFDPRGPLEARLRWLRKGTGAVLAPFEAWLTLQGSKTLHLRTRQQWGSARQIATIAQRHPAVQRVLYPGLPNHPGHDVHRSQATGDGGILALDLGSREAARAFAANLTIFTLAENLGATESLATHPVSMTHGDVPRDVRERLGITDGLVRLSCGVEETADLVADVVRALDALTGKPRRLLEVAA